MLVVLLIMVQVAPKALQGKDVGQMLTALLQMLFGLALLGGLITVLGLIVWFKVLKGHKKGRPPEQTKPR